MEPPDVGFFNAGQKMQFWEILVGCVVFVITGVIMWFPEISGRTLVSISYVLHDISALVMLFGIFFHIYLSTFGEPHTIQAMTRGTVSEAWAWTHHPAWYQAVTGRDPYQAMEQERQRRDGTRSQTVSPASLPSQSAPAETPDPVKAGRVQSMLRSLQFWKS
jgi:cytochrome b subunit of formate dehydrogenase